MDIDKELQGFLSLVQKPSRYIGGELNLHGKDPESVPFHVVLAFPEVYEIGMSHLGIKILYHLINSRSNVLADRVFSPWVDMELELRKRDLPLWGLETKIPLHSFDVVGLSLMHELMYSNVLTILDLGKIPLKSEERSSRDPIVIGGGPCASNPEPLAPFVDAFVIGEGEEVTGEIIDCLVAGKKKRLSRERMLLGLAEIDGLYVPRFYRPVYASGGEYTGLEPIRSNVPKKIRKRAPSSLKDLFYPTAPLVPLSRIVQDRLDIELFRGCTRGCRFCHAGYFYRPVREREPNAVLNQVKAGLRQSGWEEFGLLSLSTSDYTNIEPLLGSLSEELHQRSVSCSLPSLRVDNFSLSLAREVAGLKKTGLTFAPEAGTERLRRVINKCIGRDTILETSRIAYSEGWNLIKCYFMIGLPTETATDIEGLIDLSLEISKTARDIDRNNRLTVSIGMFVPKPHTPFQWESFCPSGELRDKIRRIRKRLRKKGIKVKWHSVNASRLEAVLARGDRRIAGVIQEAWSLGARFDEWTERFDPATWEEAMSRSGVKADDYLRERNLEEVLPWDHIDLQVSKTFFLREREKALLAETTDDCRWNKCNACGIPGAPRDNILSEEIEVPHSKSFSSVSKSLRSEKKGTRYRIVYQKGKKIRFLSHLDIIQVFSRSFRVAGLPVDFTRGRAPRPKMSAGPPLPTGLVGENELLDLYLSQEGEFNIVRMVLPCLPEGLIISSAYPVPLHSPSLSSQLVWGDYMSVLPEGTPGGLEALSEIVERFSQEKTHTAVVPRKEKIRTVDMKKAVLRMVVLPDPPLTLSFLAKLLDLGGNTASPLFVLQELFSFDRETLAAVVTTRKQLLNADLNPLDEHRVVHP